MSQTLSELIEPQPFDEQGFEKFKQDYPEYFQGGTLEKQKEIYQVKKQRDERIAAEKRAEKREELRKLDESVIAAETERIIQQTANKTYSDGNFIEYCKQTFQEVWFGDSHILEGILYQAAHLRISNAREGIHIHVSGETQSGKSDSVKKALLFIPNENKLERQFSRTYLFYAKLQPQTIIFADDIIFDPETAGFFRSILTSWHTGIERGITGKDGQAKEQRIPKRVSLVLTAIESVVAEDEEGQDESRFLQLEVRRSPEQMKQIRKFILQVPKDISNNLAVVRAIWNLVQNDIEVVLHEGIVNNSTIKENTPTRDFKRYVTLVQAHALLCGRTITNEQDVDAIDKFLTYSKPMLNATTPAFTRKEKAVLQVLTSELQDCQEIQSKLKTLTIYDVYRAIHGNRGSFKQPKEEIRRQKRNQKLKIMRLAAKLYFKGNPKCLCGCGREVPITKKRTSQYFNDACRMKAKRRRDKEKKVISP